MTHKKNKQTKKTKPLKKYQKTNKLKIITTKKEKKIQNNNTYIQILNVPRMD